MDTKLLEKLATKVSLKKDSEEYHISNKIRKAVSKIKFKQKDAKKTHNSRGGLISMGARGAYIKDTGLYSKRVIVKAKYIINKTTSYEEKVLKHIRADAPLNNFS